MRCQNNRHLLLAGQIEIRRSEDVELATLDQIEGGVVEQLTNLDGAARSDAQGLQNGDEEVGDGAASPGHAETLQGEGTFQRVVPGDLVINRGDTARHFEGIEDLPAGVLQSLVNLFNTGDFGQAVTDLNTLLNALVLRVLGVKVLSHNPLVSGEETTLLGDTGELLEAGSLIRGVASGLNLVDVVELLILEGELHEVLLTERAQLAELVTSDPLVTNNDLVVVVVDTDDVSTGEASNVAHGATDTSTEVSNLVTTAKTETQGQIVLVAAERVLVRLAGNAGTEVERLTPTILVEISDQVVELVDHLSVAGFALAHQGVVLGTTSARVLAIKLLITSRLLLGVDAGGLDVLVVQHGDETVLVLTILENGEQATNDTANDPVIENEGTERGGNNQENGGNSTKNDDW
jgi:hypothetical protein